MYRFIVHCFFVIYGCALCNNALLLTTVIIKKEMPQNRILLKKTA